MTITAPNAAPPLSYSADEVAAAIASLDRTTILFLGSVPGDGRITVGQAGDILDASYVRVYELMDKGLLPYETVNTKRSLHVCDVVALRDTPKS